MSRSLDGLKLSHFKVKFFLKTFFGVDGLVVLLLHGSVFLFGIEKLKLPLSFLLFDLTL